jgi:aldehyde:ferredoxin oxidoreductase
MPPGVDPLGPDNVLAFTTSIINGLSLSGTNRYTAAAKSPLTGGYGESEAGGWWAPELRAAGYDGIAVRGRAESPVYLWIKDGRSSSATPRLLGQARARCRRDRESWATSDPGPPDRRSGERGVRFAAIVNQLKHFHGRCGRRGHGREEPKAIAVRGEATVPADKVAPSPPSPSS